ncbi:MAG: hypothetical protein WCG34_04495 [Leptolinea sp.]
MRQIDIEVRMLYNKELLCEAKNFRNNKLAAAFKAQQKSTIIPFSSQKVEQKIHKSILYWLAGLFPDLACQYHWVPCEN